MEDNTGPQLHMAKENRIPVEPMWVKRAPGSRGEGIGRQRCPQVRDKREEVGMYRTQI